MKQAKKQSQTKLRWAWVWACLCWAVMLQTGCNCNGLLAPGGTPLPDPNQNIKKDNNPPCLQITPVDFGGLALRCTTALRREVEIKHLGLPHCPKSIAIQGADFSVASAGAFELTNPTTFPISVEAGQSVRMTIGFRAKALGPAQATIELKTDAPQQEKLQVPLTGTGTDDQTLTEKFQQESLASDILFVIDNSCSMQEEQSNLANNFSSFIQWAQKLKADFQIGVITTNARGEAASCLVGPVGKKILTSKTPDLAAAFSANAQLGTSGSGNETGLHSAYLALSHPRVAGCNQGFLRDNAVLSMIFVSDEPDHSEQDVAFYLRIFRRLKGEGREHLLRASAVVGPELTGCTSPHGNALGGARYIEVARELGGIHASICENNWSENLKAIGLSSIISRFHFPLKQPPESDSLVVFVDGKAVPLSEQDGWQYDAKTNQVSFRGSHIPSPGAQIEIKYLPQCPGETP